MRDDVIWCKFCGVLPVGRITRGLKSWCSRSCRKNGEAARHRQRHRYDENYRSKSLRAVSKWRIRCRDVVRDQVMRAVNEEAKAKGVPKETIMSLWKVPTKPTGEPHAN